MSYLHKELDSRESNLLSPWVIPTDLLQVFVSKGRSVEGGDDGPTKYGFNNWFGTTEIVNNQKVRLYVLNRSYVSDSFLSYGREEHCNRSVLCPSYMITNQIQTRNKRQKVPTVARDVP